MISKVRNHLNHLKIMNLLRIIILEIASNRIIISKEIISTPLAIQFNLLTNNIIKMTNFTKTKIKIISTKYS